MAQLRHTRLVDPELPQETSRLASLRSLRILDTPPEERFDRITRLAQKIFNVPVSVISLVDARRQWFKSRQGLSVSETPRDISFCTHAIQRPELFVVPDALEDPRFTKSPLVTADPHIRFYAGRPLAAVDGSRVGTLCLIDRKPRQLTQAEMAILDDLGTMAEEQLNWASELNESEQRFQAIFDQGPIAMDVVDIKTWQFVRVNDAFCKSLGYTREEIARMTVRDIIPPEAVKDHEEMVASLIGGERPFFQTECYHVQKNGRRLWARVFVSLLKDERQEPRFLIAVAEDITERKEAQEQLSVSEDRFKTVARATSDIVWDLDLTTRTLWWSDGIETVCRYRKEDVAPDLEWWTERVHPDDRERTQSSLDHAIDQGEPFWSSEYRFRRADGTYAHIFDRGFVLYNTDGKPTRMVGAMIDASDRKRLEAAVAQAEKMSTVGHFVAGIAHDLNNPIAVILGFSQIMLGEPLPEILQMPAQAIAREAERCKVLIQELLAFSRTGKSQTQPAIVRVKPVIESALTLVETLAKSRHVELVRQLDDSLPEAWLDRNQIQQVLINLCTNAIDAMPKGGRLTVGASQKDAQLVQLVVRDTGTGIPPEIRERIFEPFYTTKEVGKGTGLGLSLVADIVKNHHGKIELESEPGRGTTFTITLPIQPPAAERKKAA